jgi:hypothetical protein
MLKHRAVSCCTFPETSTASAHSKEISEEVHCHKPLDLLTDMAYCAALSRVAVGGGSSVKLIDVGAEYGEVAGEGVELPPGHSVEKVGWGQDGQVGMLLLVAAAAAHCLFDQFLLLPCCCLLQILTSVH